MADALLSLGMLSLIVLCGYYADEIEDLWKSKPRVPSREWRDMIEPIVKKCHLAEALEMNTSFNPDGSKALASVLERMADELDRRS